MGCQALLEQHMADDRRGRITLRLQGRRHEDLAHWLRERIERHNHRFGYPDLAPTVDQLGPRLHGVESAGESHRQLGGVPERGSTSLVKAALADAEARPAAGGPVFDKPPAAFFPAREPQVFVSYAWGDETAEGRQRQEIVDDLCAALGTAGVKVRRDRDELRPGDLIGDFMDRLAGGDFIITVISDKYLRSEYCMYELFRIYRNCADKPERFLRRVIPLILADAKLDGLVDRWERATYWVQQEADLRGRILIPASVDAVGTIFFGKFKLIGEFARNTSDMLEHLIDKLMPRDFDRMAADGFRDVLQQIRP